MIRRIFLTILILMLAPLGGAKAEKPAGVADASASLSADQARAALDVLNDPAKRAAFSATLNAIIKAGPTVAAPAAAAPNTAPPTSADATVEGLNIPLAPDSLGAEVLLSASAFVTRVGIKTMKALETVQSLPLLYGWAVVMVTNPVARTLLTDVSWRVAVVLICAASVEYGLHRALRRPILGLERLAPVVRPADTDEPLSAEDDAEALARAEAGEVEAPTPRKLVPSAWILLERVPLVLARLVLDLIPVIGIVLVGHLIAGSSLGGRTASRLIILAVVDSYAICAGLLCVARMLLSPETSRLRLFQLRDTSAIYLMRWIRRLTLIGVIGYAVGEVGLLLGLSEIAHDALQKGVGLILHILLAALVIRNRRAVRYWMRPPAEATGVLAAVRNRLARVWHWIALFFLVAGWLIWAVELPHGFAAVLHYTIVTALVLIGTRLSLLLLLGLVDRVMRPPLEPEGLYPGMNARLRAYHPSVSTVIRVIVYLLSVLGLLQLYGLNTFLWLLESNLGQRILSAIATLLITIVVAFSVWEAANGGIQGHLSRLERDAQTSKSARLRTLLPLLRMTLLIAILIVSGLMILSEIGINIAPLLAGAGIVGVAIGFGSQKLVQDLITGIFLLLENAMQVGDWVTVSGLSGNVEALSVRTIRLRAGDGSVHIIPFSSVTSVTNVNRGLGNASVNVCVAYDEDTDRVSNEIKQILADMRSDPNFSAKMLSDFQLWGVDKVDGAATTIAGQVVCTDSGRWAVQREFNRRMKRQFQELGIRMFNPVQTISIKAPDSPRIEKVDTYDPATAAH